MSKNIYSKPNSFKNYLAYVAYRVGLSVIAVEGSTHDGESGRRLGHPGTLPTATRPLPGERGGGVPCGLPPP